MHIGFATEHGGYALKEPILSALREAGHTVLEFGACVLDPRMITQPGPFRAEDLSAQKAPGWKIAY